MSISSGVGTKVKHYNGNTVRELLIGLAQSEYIVTEDGLAYGYTSTALTHIIEFLESILPDTVHISATFPHFNYNESGQLDGSVSLPYISAKGIKGAMQEVGVGRTLWETPDGFVYGFRQFMYIEFDVFGGSSLKIDQIVDQIAIQLQKTKSTGGALFMKGFQNFQTISSDPARGFRYDTAWDFRMQHQYTPMWHARLTVRTSFDVAWLDKTSFNGIISQIIFGSSNDTTLDMVIGTAFTQAWLERNLLGWDYLGLI